MINFIKNQHILRKKIFFSKDDILSLWISEEVLNILLEEKQIRYLIDGIYTLSKEEIFLWSSLRYILSNKLYKESYITGTTALDRYNLLYWAQGGTVFTWDEKKFIDLDGLTVEILLPSTKKPDIEAIEYYLPTHLNEWRTDKYTIYFAKPEQALVDMFFNSPFVEEYFDEDELLVHFLLKEKIDKDKLLKIALETNDKKTIKSTHNLINWLKK